MAVADRGSSARLSAKDALLLLADRDLTATRFAEDCLRRVAQREPLVRAWAHLDPPNIVMAARRCDEVENCQALKGIPIAVKDIILTRDMPTAYNSPIYADFAPAIDAASVSVLRSAGAIIFGKTETVEFGATGRPAETRNPHNLTRTPGGSSSGSAAAVADFHVPIALGTQTGGSILRPASFCGIYGFKPTWNLVSAEGAKSFAPSLDTLGWFARSAEDLALILSQFERPRTGPKLTHEPVEGKRVGVISCPAWGVLDPDMEAAFAGTVDSLRRAGAIIVDLPLPAPFDQLLDHYRVISRVEGASAFQAEYQLAAELLDPSEQDMVATLGGFTHQQLLTSYNAVATMRHDFDAIAGMVDALIAPSTIGIAPSRSTGTGQANYNIPWTLLHAPAVSVPGWRGLHDMPLGITVVGKRFDDWKVLTFAAALGQLLTV